MSGQLDPLIEAEFEILRALGVTVCATPTLDGQDSRWNATHRALLVGTDLTPEEAEGDACEVLGMLVAELAAVEAPEPAQAEPSPFRATTRAMAPEVADRLGAGDLDGALAAFLSWLDQR